MIRWSTIFYRKAQEQRKAEMEKVSKGIEDPRGPAEDRREEFPLSRGRGRAVEESGIISLADAVESASRSLKKPTPAKIRALIEEIVRRGCAEGQLDQC